jgi:long-chain acyl-CoA synthetase
MERKPWVEKYDKGVPVHIDYPQIPVFTLLKETAGRHPGKACTIFEGKEITYSEVEQASSHLAKVLIDMGVKRGDPIGMFMPNIPEFVIVYYAILKAGGIVSAMNPQYRMREIQQQANDVGMELLFTTGTDYQLIKSVQGRTFIKKVIVIRTPVSLRTDSYDLDGPVMPDERFEDLLDKEPVSKGIEASLNERDIAIYQYTGGTTGTPKAAIGLHRNLVSNTHQFWRWLVNITEGQETLLMAIPMYHVYGMVLGMSLGIAIGASLVMVPDARNLKSLLTSLEQYRATIFPGVPNLFGSIIRNAEVSAGKYNLSSLKACISGSAPLPPETRLKFEQISGGKLCEGYGLSEAPTATHCNPILGENRIGSIGLPLPDVDCQIVDMENGTKPLGSGQVGELIVKGPQVMPGYYHMEDETKSVLRDGWLFTGDIGRMDQDGYFYLVDRKKEVIKVGGFQVWPKEVEDVIASHPQVMEVGVAGIPDNYRGETPKAWVVKKPGETLSEQEVRKWCEPFLAPYKIPSEVEFRTELPRTTVGKVLRRELKREHIEERERQSKLKE